MDKNKGMEKTGEACYTKKNQSVPGRRVSFCAKDTRKKKPEKETKKEPVKKPAVKKAESKKAEPKKAEPKKAEPKKAEPKKAEPKKAEPKKAEPKKAEPKKLKTNRQSRTGTIEDTASLYEKSKIVFKEKGNELLKITKKLLEDNKKKFTEAQYKDFNKKISEADDTYSYEQRLNKFKDLEEEMKKDIKKY
ncbi:MAG: hypothetical protein H8E55_59375 [Pelagibacterales bacterium]|nr:hypothetical protein [Pelagibacterales bacterium]